MSSNNQALHIKAGGGGENHAAENAVTRKNICTGMHWSYVKNENNGGM